MKLLTFIGCLFLAGCSAAPSGRQDIVVEENVFRAGNVLYTGKHDIVKLFVPFKQFNFEDEIEITGAASSSSSEETETKYTLFFVEGDVTNEKVTYKGLYVLKNGKATKLLNNGRDATATHSNAIYFGAKDGIYKYDNDTNTAKKHGTVTDSIIQLAYNNKTNAIYYLTEGHEVYRLNEDATTSIKVPALKDVQEMVFGFDGNLYYYTSDNTFYVVDIEVGDAPQKINGLPTHMNKIALVSPMYGMEIGAILYVDEKIYGLYPIQHAEKLPIQIKVPLTAQAPQATLIHFYAKDKKIYEFNIILIMLGSLLEGLDEALSGHSAVISSLKKSSF